MEKSYYKMYPEKHLGIVRFKSGDLTMKDILRVNHEYKIDKNFSNIHYLIMIFTGCIPTFDKKGLEQFLESFLHNSQINNHKKRVLVVDKPMTTAFAHIFIDNVADVSKYCSTIEKAYFLLGLDISYSEYLNLITEFE